MPLLELEPELPLLELRLPELPLLELRFAELRFAELPLLLELPLPPEAPDVVREPEARPRVEAARLEPPELRLLELLPPELRLELFAAPEGLDAPEDPLDFFAALERLALDPLELRLRAEELFFCAEELPLEAEAPLPEADVLFSADALPPLLLLELPFFDADEPLLVDARLVDPRLVVAAMSHLRVSACSRVPLPF